MREPIAIGPWKGGVNVEDSERELPPDQLSSSFNCRIDELGWPYKRPGFRDYGSSPAKINGDNLVNFNTRFYKVGGAKESVAAAGGRLKKGNDITGAWTEIDINGAIGTNMSSTELVDSIVYKNRLYLADGLRPQRYNGTDNVYAGHYIPVSSGWSTANAGGGDLTLLGTYRYIMTIVAGDMGEGPASAAKIHALTGVADEIQITNLDSAPASHEATAKRLYRTRANGTVFYFLNEITASATFYNDTAADSALGSEYIPTHIPKASARFVILGPDDRTYWFGMSGAEASLVDASDVGFPDRILDDEFFTVNNNDGDELTGGAVVGNNLVFFKRRSVWITPGLGYGPRKIEGAIGCSARFSIVKTPGGLMWLGSDGRIYFYDGSSSPEEVGRKVRSELSLMTETQLKKVTAVYHDFRYIISFDKDGAKGYNWTTWEFDVRNGRWSGPYEGLTPSYYAVWTPDRDSGELSWGEAKASLGSYLRVRDKYSKTDNGSKFVGTIDTSFNLISALNDKKVYKIFVEAEMSADNKLQATLFGDPGNNQTTLDLFVALSIAPSNALVWGSGNWGEKIWFGNQSTYHAEKSFNPKGRGKALKLRISDNGNGTSFKLVEINLLASGLPLK